MTLHTFMQALAQYNLISTPQVISSLCPDIKLLIGKLSNASMGLTFQY